MVTDFEATHYLYPRYLKKTKKTVYYAKLKVNGKYSAINTNETTVSKANLFANNHIEKLKADYAAKIEAERIEADRIEAEKNRCPTFGEYAKDFYLFGGKWSTSRIIDNGRISERWCNNKQILLKTCVFPFFKNIPLNQIKKQTIKDFKIFLYEQGKAGGTINKALTAVKGVLEYAADAGIINGVPVFDRAAERPKERGILDENEFNRLFRVQWHDERVKIANHLAALTALRLGEIQALTIADVNIDDLKIYVRRSYDNHFHKFNETTKTGKTRIVPITKELSEILKTYITKFHPYANNPESFLFFGDLYTINTKSRIIKKPTEQRPLGQRTIYFGLKQALKQIGINEAERQQRNITFHSWRHYCNSYFLNHGCNPQKVKTITGHNTTEMQEHYYHIDDLDDIRIIQETMFSGVNMETVN